MPSGRFVVNGQVVKRLASDLRAEFTDARGFSARNVWDMRRLYETYTAPEFLQQPVAESEASMSKTLPGSGSPGDPAHHKFLPQTAAEMETSILPEDSDSEIPSPSVRELISSVPWGHHRLLLDKVTDPAARLYYLRATARFGWSRNVLLNQIKAGAYEPAVVEKKTHNFDLALPEYLAEQADEMLKSRYNLEFLGIRREVKERELEDRLIAHLQRFLLELGYGFCFLGRQ